MLIRVPEHSAADLEAWERETAQDAIVARGALHRRRVTEAIRAVRDFAAAGRCYASASWGKDSTVLAHLIASHAPEVPVVWVNRVPMDVPYCDLVRDEFCRRWPQASVHTVTVQCVRGHKPGDIHQWWALDESGQSIDYSAYPKQIGFARVAAQFGDRYLSGVRADESSVRTVGIRRRGLITDRTCSPIGHWTGADVFAYLHTYDLPVHPSYAMSMGGLLSRDRLRVGSLGGPHGRGHGRAEWEQRYYGRRLAEIRRMPIS